MTVTGSQFGYGCGVGVAYIIVVTKSDAVTVECHRSLAVGSCSHRQVLERDRCDLGCSCKQ